MIKIEFSMQRKRGIVNTIFREHFNINTPEGGTDLTELSCLVARLTKVLDENNKSDRSTQDILDEAYKIIIEGDRQNGKN